MPERPDWNTRYLTGNTPWDHRSPALALERVLREWEIRPCRALEMGCGTGGDAVHLAQAGFDVTAFDIAPRAVEQAKRRAAEAGVRVVFLTGDFRGLGDLGAPFDFVYDSGFYHSVRGEALADLLAFLERVTRPGSLWLTLAGNADGARPNEEGPPRVRAAELCAELESAFALVELRQTRFGAVGAPGGDAEEEARPLAWSALLRRR